MVNVSPCLMILPTVEELVKHASQVKAAVRVCVRHSAAMAIVAYVVKYVRQGVVNLMTAASHKYLALALAPP